MKYTEITSFEKACEALNRSAELPDVSMIPEHLRRFILDTFKLATCVEAMNHVYQPGGWKPDYSDDNQRKYYSFFWVDADQERPSGFGFSASDYGYAYADASGGSRFCFPELDMVWHAQKHFEEFYKGHLLMVS